MIVSRVRPALPNGGNTLSSLSTKGWKICLVAVSLAAVCLMALPHRIGTLLEARSSLISKRPTDEQYTSTPFCTPNGDCGEEPDQPSPRTVFSSKSKQYFDDWWDFHMTLHYSALSFAHRLRGKSGEDTKDEAGVATKKRSPPLILLGDSITESYLGTSVGFRVEKHEKVPYVLENMYSEYEPLVLAVSGDQTQHLLWRLENGQLLPEFAEDPGAIFVVLIGTNNIGKGHLPEPTAKGILAVADYVLKHIVGRLVLIELLPRADMVRLEVLCPPRCDDEGKALSSFMPAVNKVNAYLRDAVPSLSQQYPNRFDLIDCGEPFILPAKGETNSTSPEIDDSLMPDFLHPNAKGHQHLASCVLDCIRDGKC